MLNREMSWVLRFGELDTRVVDKASYSFVGGSPVALDSDGKISGYLGVDDVAQEASFFGVAWHSLDFDEAEGAKSTVIFSPAILILEQGSEKLEATGVVFADAVPPWETGKTYAVSNLLRPVVSTGTPAYAVWTNDAYTDEVEDVIYPYPAKLISFEGSAAAPTKMKIALGPFYKKATV